MSLINYNNIQLYSPTPTYNLYNLSNTPEEEDEFFATTTQSYYKSRYYHHEHQHSASISLVPGLPHHMLSQTAMEPSREYKAMITPAPSDPIRKVKERKLQPNRRNTRLALTKHKTNKIRRVKMLFYQMLHVVFRAPTSQKRIHGL